MKKIFKIIILLILAILIVLSPKITANKNEDFSEDNEFKTWIDVNKKEFYDNEVINLQTNMRYIGEQEEIDVYLPKNPFQLLITGNNGFRSIIKSHNMFGTLVHTFEKDETITMDCSIYMYNYFYALDVFKGYEHPESRMGAGGKLKLPPGDYTLTLTSWYEDNLSGESRHELYATEYISVKAKINRKSIHETKSTKNFKIEANLDKNIYEVDELYIFGLV